MNPPPRTLTPRQTRIVRLYANGRTTVQIAAILGCGTDTVRRHTAEARARLGADTLPQLVALAGRLGVLRDGDIDVPPLAHAQPEGTS